MGNRRRSRAAGRRRPGRSATSKVAARGRRRSKTDDERSTRHHERPQVLVVGDDPGHRWLLEDVLEDAGYRVMLAEGGEEALATLAHQRPALMTLDLRRPRVDAWCVLEHLAGLSWRPPVVVISAHGEADRVRALGRSDVLYVDKPFKIDELLGLCRALLPPPHSFSIAT